MLCHIWVSADLGGSALAGMLKIMGEDHGAK